MIYRVHSLICSERAGVVMTGSTAWETLGKARVTVAVPKPSAQAASCVFWRGLCPSRKQPGSYFGILAFS